MLSVIFEATLYVELEFHVVSAFSPEACRNPFWNKESFLNIINILKYISKYLLILYLLSLWESD